MTDKNTLTALGRILMDLSRKREHWEPGALARACGLSRMTIYNLKYKGGCTTGTLGRIFRGLKLNQQEWFEIGLAISGAPPPPSGEPISDHQALSTFTITTEDL